MTGLSWLHAAWWWSLSTTDWAYWVSLVGTRSTYWVSLVYLNASANKFVLRLFLKMLTFGDTVIFYGRISQISGADISEIYCTFCLRSTQYTTPCTFCLRSTQYTTPTSIVPPVEESALRQTAALCLVVCEQ